MMKLTDAVKHILIINVVMFIGTLTIGEGRLFYDIFSLYFPENNAFKPWQVLTHMFMHGGPSHLLFNMFALWMFGTPVEQRLGTKRFLFIYLSAGLGAVLFQLGFSYFEFYDGLSTITEIGIPQSEIMTALDSAIRLENTNLIDLMSVDDIRKFESAFKVPMVGASGCIMGVLVAFGMMNPNAELMLIFLPIPIKAKYFIPGIIILDIVSAVTGQSFFSPSNTAYMAHVGGAFIGFVIMWYWKKTQFNSKRWN